MPGEAKITRKYERNYRLTVHFCIHKIKAKHMKKTVIVFGLIAGAIVCLLWLITAICMVKGYFKGSEVVGYTGMLVAFSFVFIGVKNYRDKYNNRVISFGKAFRTGLYITLVASTMYVLAWLIEYYVFFPDFMEKYCVHTIDQAKASGISQQALDKKITQMASMKEMYKNPLFVVLFTYLEILPVGIIISLISALILKRKGKSQVAMA
jgi:uncharacterized protein DUF4199